MSPRTKYPRRAKRAPAGRLDTALVLALAEAREDAAEARVGLGQCQRRLAEAHKSLQDATTEIRRCHVTFAKIAPLTANADPTAVELHRHLRVSRSSAATPEPRAVIKLNPNRRGPVR